MTGAPLGTVLKHDDTIESAAFSPDGARVLTSSRAAARLWEVPQTPPRRQLIELACERLRSTRIDPLPNALREESFRDEPYTPACERRGLLDPQKYVEAFESVFGE
jgi:hypothetical protein